MSRRRRRWLRATVPGSLLASLAACALAAAPASAGAAAGAGARVALHWMGGYRAQGTPRRYDRVGVIEVGSPRARNVLVLEPGTSAAAAYFVPLAKWIVSRRPGWQVWAVQRRETLLQDESELNRAKSRHATATQLFDYYLGWLAQPYFAGPHYQFVQSSSVAFAKRWGMKVAVQDLHRVIGAARRLGGEVVLGGHSLGGAVVTAYATWDFGGRAGADGLSGLVYIDGSSGAAETAAQARAALRTLDATMASPWLTFGGIAAPFAGLFNAVGSTAALIDPNGLSNAQSFSLLPTDLKPPVPATNLGQYGYALNVATSPPALAAAQAHLGAGLDTTTSPAGWNSTGALTPIDRFAQMFSGWGLKGVDGTEWYFPQRLTDDTAAVGNGLANPAQKVLGLDATMGRKLPRALRIYAFCTSLGGPRVLAATRALARQSHIPARNLTLVDRASSYAHNDPAGAYPSNAFFSGLIRFLGSLGS
jgi:hypothetical protein